jgi:hypothetical protein
LPGGQKRKEEKVKNSSTSMLVFALYLAALGLLLIFYPKAFLLLGFEDVSGPWVRILGYVVGVLAFYFFMAIREETTRFYWWTVYARLPLIFFYAALVVPGIAPPSMLLIGAWETGCAIWTGLALRNEKAT